MDKTAARWILDFEGYQVRHVFYPLEIALLNVDRTNVCYNWHIRYEVFPATYDASTTRQFQLHGLYWKHGNKNLHVALDELRKVVNEYGELEQRHIIFVKGLEKTNWVKRWFYCNDSIVVREILNAPSFSDFSLLDGAQYACIHHTDAFHLRCASRKVYQMLPYVNAMD